MALFFIFICMKVLREYVRDLLTEIAARDLSGLGLYIQSHGNFMQFVLYDAQEFIKQTQENRRLTFDQSMVKGMITVTRSGQYGNCHGAWEINNIAATGGYGLTLFDIALSSVPGNTLMPDRAEVSPVARTVLRFYKGRKKNLQSLKFDTEPKDPRARTRGKEDDCMSMHQKDQDILDYAYRLVGGPSVDISEPLHVHAQIVRGLNKLKDGLGSGFEAALSKGGIEFFGAAHIGALT